MQHRDQVEAMEVQLHQSLPTALRRCAALSWRRHVEEQAAPCTSLAALLEERLPVVHNGVVCVYQV